MIIGPEITGRKPSFNDMGAMRLNPEHPLNRGLVAWWLMNEGGGKIVFDATRRLNTGFSSVPAWSSKGLIFDGVDDYLTVATPAILAAANPVSVVCKARLLETGLKGMFNITQSTDQVLVCYWDTDFARVKSCHLADASYTQISNTITHSDWNHFVITHPGGNVVPGHYINGIAANNASGAQLTAWSTSKIEIAAGLSYNSAYNANAEYEYVLIYSRVLSSSEVTQLYINPFGTPDNPRLLYPSRRTWFVPTVVSGFVPHASSYYRRLHCA